MPREPKPQPPPRQCLFCERTANSGEHMWPAWMASYFERGAHDKSLQVRQRIGANDQSPLEPKVIHGHPTTRKVKCVCKQCNNGWMSGLETENKPHLERMLQGRRTSLDVAQQLSLTHWITLKMMVWDVTDERGRVFTRAQTLAFAKDRALPNNLAIWLLRSETLYQ
jgi:hypothetical protein